ncbi:related to phosphatidic acid-preferring phospholipase A1, contains DDHD domain [Lecanosticta acicola]|uniref:Related to phosphatidic acid-preferring phospholipase A1, contains DDHD domain n=1 Tax=Lecanosticta acicola TaxID=111012 RepID=A0AAI8YU11_9PEZI|nr:related to phosphatidic acid-preferring phospholipase A1, contains DDHD domain [Lecanosticta acicola]
MSTTPASSTTHQYLRQVLHQTDPPPPIKARFFYTSTIPIDDPLSPLPPPASSDSTWVRQPPKPFSEYDNTALDKAWNQLRHQILRYDEERGEKDGSHEDSRVRSRTSASTARGRSGSGSKGALSRSRHAKQPASGLSQVDTWQEDDASTAEVPESASDLAAGTDTTGNPFTRLPSKQKLDPSSAQRFEDRPARPMHRTLDSYTWDDPSHLAEHSPAPEKRKKKVDPSPTAKVAVGISRLHQVEMPELHMTPIYWAPVHDTAQVMRGTWFYEDTMLPVETPVANMLEAGYIDLQCWTETWQDELNSAVEVGALGEMKIVHKLWPDKPRKSVNSRGSESGSRRGTIRDDNLLRAATTNLFEDEPESIEQQRHRAVEAACDIIDVSTGAGGVDNKAYGEATYGRAGAVRTYGTCGVIYANEREAKILKPTLLPSAYYGRRPLANYVRKNHKIGIPVVRGFDQSKWDKLYPPKKGGAMQEKAERGVAAAGPDADRRRKQDPDLAKADRPKVTDLVFVIHGIGQKLSQRMESFHFTHAINAFRREIMVECGNKEVKHRFRGDMGGIMVLPINWRHSLSFEEGGYRPDDPAGAQPDSTINEFTLNDITPDTLPSVRGIVSDVMLDIPYYMSHHQPKMIAAVIREANRVYRIWCHNNPGFAEHGNVHIIAHSLGSVMSIDILSKQPTTVPKHLSDPTQIDLDAEEVDHFLFNTHNLFLAGSPAGFFLLLRRAQLRPRIDHPSAQAIADPTSNIAAICGERGEYGCISVHNIYNIINGYDPVAYRMNAAVDTSYSAALKKAFIPSNTPSFWFPPGTSNTARWFGGIGGPATSAATNLNVPSMPRLPSNVELETHNFTREELAEKRMTLLNDNGQIDYFVKYGGGTFEIQYLTMLGAHSAYWGLKDFIRMVVVEIGREGGREGTLAGLRAGKKRGGAAAGLSAAANK